MGSSERFARISKYFAECFTPFLKGLPWPFSRLAACSAVVALRTRDLMEFILMRDSGVGSGSGSSSGGSCCCFGTASLVLRLVVMLVSHLIEYVC